VPTLRFGKVWQILTFHNVSFNFATAMSKFDTFSSYHIVRTQIAKVTASFYLFALTELVCTKKVPYPIHYSLLIYPKLILLWSVPDGRTEKIVHPLFPNSFFSPLSARGPTRRRKFTGLAKLRGGWPIETSYEKKNRLFFVRHSTCKKIAKILSYFVR
jgi:hypothetical protein